VQINVDVPDGQSGDWKVSTFTVDEKDIAISNAQAAFKLGCRIMRAGTYKQLTRNGYMVMSNTHAEIRDHQSFIWRARKGGHILINGLGLGVALKAILESTEVESVTIIEASLDVIELVAPTYKTDPRVVIIHADAYTWKPPKGMRYDACWHDIWDDISVANLPEMTKLHRKYGRRTDWQGSWCKELCIRHRDDEKRQRGGWW